MVRYLGSEGFSMMFSQIFIVICGSEAKDSVDQLGKVSDEELSTHADHLLSLSKKQSRRRKTERSVSFVWKVELTISPSPPLFLQAPTDLCIVIRPNDTSLDESIKLSFFRSPVGSELLSFRCSKGGGEGGELTSLSCESVGVGDF